MIYQDGVSHAISYLHFKTKTGQTYNPIELMDQLVIYEEEIRKKLSKNRNYMDLAYVNGYIEGLAIPMFYDEIKDFPFHFLYGVGPTNDSKMAYETYEKDIICTSHYLT
ncbi:hypothetical protein [Flagellimonas onchidii]|uniref:hypothetical protein n=1 Tax=Flagellimonas onchidii TaxID=2562684 RepID=UPI0010A65465|nr:hypothetical protein [Allomuricauda onchidii]